MSDAELLPEPPTAQRRAAAPEPKGEMGKVEVKPAPKRARASRKSTETRERRRRDTNDYSNNLKLDVNFDLDPAYEYRWINGGVDSQRLHDKHGEDWDMVSKDGAVSDGVGTGLRRAVGRDAAGPIYTHLCRKPKEWYEQDQAKRQSRNDRLMTAIKEGRDPTGSGKGLSQGDNKHGEGLSVTGRA